MLLLLVKEDLSICVVFLGIWLATRGERAHGIALAVVGIAWYELATHVLIPHFALTSRYAYWTYGELGKNPLDAIWALITHPWRLFTIGFSPAQKARTMLALLAPFLFLSLGSRLFIVALPLLAERFLSTNPAFWSSHFHYSLALAPVLAMGAAGGLANLARAFPAPRRRAVIVGAASAMLVASLTITRLATSDSALSRLTQPSFYEAPADAAGELDAVRHVPPMASLATTDFVLPHASERQRLELIRPTTVGDDEYLVINALHPGCCGATGNHTQAELGRSVDAELARMTPVYYADGWLVARRAPPGTAPANGVLAPMPSAVAGQVTGLAQHASIELTAYGPCYGEWLREQVGAAACFAAANRRRRALELAAQAAQRDENDLDLSGALERFLLLCRPRGP